MLHTEPMQKVRVFSLDGDKPAVVAALHVMGVIDLRKSRLPIGDDHPAADATSISDALIKVTGALQLLQPHSIKQERHRDTDRLIAEVGRLKVLNEIYSLGNERKLIEDDQKAVVVKNLHGVRLNLERMRRGSIVHLRCGFQKAEKCLDGGIADMLAIDINSGGIASSGAVLRYSRFMKKGAYLIMTVKCIMRSVPKYMREVESRLGSRFRILRWKVLPHNRQEITLFARKR